RGGSRCRLVLNCLRHASKSESRSYANSPPRLRLSGAVRPCASDSQTVKIQSCRNWLAACRLCLRRASIERGQSDADRRLPVVPLLGMRRPRCLKAAVFSTIVHPVGVSAVAHVTTYLFSSRATPI